jgi:hypothetical protein
MGISQPTSDAPVASESETLCASDSFGCGKTVGAGLERGLAGFIGREKEKRAPPIDRSQNRRFRGAYATALTHCWKIPLLPTSK